MLIDPDTQYQRMLGSFEGDEFEAEACAKLQMSIPDFQTVPSKPSGDGGLDGLSHKQTRAYCCYGPVQSSFKSNTKGLKDNIVEKFRSDLRTLFELELNGSNALAHKDTVPLKTIIADGNKIKHIYLLVSVFNTHQIIGPLNSSLKKYIKASNLTYIDANVTLAIWGPDQITCLSPTDEATLFRIENKAFSNMLKAHGSSHISPTDKGEFQDKFDYIRTMLTKKGASAQRIQTINEMQASFEKAWSACLAFELNLSQNSISLHEALETARGTGTTSALLKSGPDVNPQDLIQEMMIEMRTLIKESFNIGDMPEIRKVAQGEVARLIGECPVDWRP